MSPEVSSVVIIVPCFNEEIRLQPSEFLRLASSSAVSLLFIDDGSIDNTLKILENLQAQAPNKVSILKQPKNGGKAEAIRTGFQRVLMAPQDSAVKWIGYLDADLATSVDDANRMVQVALEGPSELQAVFAARVGLLGTQIERRKSRHYLGRVFATFASMILNLRIYDTQCGAKLFRKSDLLRAVTEKPFVAKWAFDVEFIARLLKGTKTHSGLIEQNFIEVPLKAWKDIKGSKLKLKDVFRMGIELVKIFVFYR